MTVSLWSALMALYFCLAVAILWWGWALPDEPEGQVVPGEDHAEVVKRMRMIQGGKR